MQPHARARLEQRAGRKEEEQEEEGEKKEGWRKRKNERDSRARAQALCRSIPSRAYEIYKRWIKRAGQVIRETETSWRYSRLLAGCPLSKACLSIIEVALNSPALFFFCLQYAHTRAYLLSLYYLCLSPGRDARALSIATILVWVSLSLFSKRRFSTRRLMGIVMGYLVRVECRARRTRESMGAERKWVINCEGVLMRCVRKVTKMRRGGWLSEVYGTYRSLEMFDVSVDAWWMCIDLWGFKVKMVSFLWEINFWSKNCILK